MKIELHEITVKELTDGFQDNAEAGVIGYGGKLDIRPPYQREFIYKDKQRVDENQGINSNCTTTRGSFMSLYFVNALI